MGWHLYIWFLSLGDPVPPSPWADRFLHVFKIELVTLILNEHWWEDHEKDFLNPDHEVDRHDMKVKHDVIGEEHVNKDVDELILFICLGWL